MIKNYGLAARPGEENSLRPGGAVMLLVVGLLREDLTRSLGELDVPAGLVRPAGVVDVPIGAVIVDLDFLPTDIACRLQRPFDACLFLLRGRAVGGGAAFPPAPLSGSGLRGMAVP